MSFGMGLTFVPVTLTAVHHLRAEDSGIGSGVLNTMQQVGGALGLAMLSTVATQIFTDRGDELAQAGAAAQRPVPRADAEQAATLQEIAQHADLHRGRDPRVPGRLDPDARGVRWSSGSSSTSSTRSWPPTAPRASTSADRRTDPLRPARLRSHRRTSVTEPLLTMYDAPGAPRR